MTQQQSTAQRIAHMASVAAAFVLATAWLPAQAELYRWVDDSGQVHYSDKKPDQNNPRAGEAETLKFAPGSVAAKARRDQAEAEAREAEKVVARCTAARSQLDTYTRAVSLVRQQPDGSEVELTPEERVELIEQAQRKVASNCTEPTG